MANEPTIKKGNTKVFDIPVYDENDTLAVNLATVASAKFTVSSDRRMLAPEITKTLIAGIDVNTPSAGYVRVTLSPTDTAIAIGKYYIALQLTWSAVIVYEVDLTIDDVATSFVYVVDDIIT